MNWVKDAVEGSWERVSAVNFTGWGTCNNESKGIRILIDDSNPQTQVPPDSGRLSSLGSDLDSIRNGMVLNFTFQNWTGASDGQELCQDGGRVPRGFNDPNKIQSNTEREFCVKVLALHEFGHALGFAHEQTRPDTPSNCTAEKQGTPGDLTIGKWDLNSIMNYCNPNWNGNGSLSAEDVRGVQRMYGTPFTLQTGTALHETGSEFSFDMADWDRDGKSDLVAIKKSATGSGTTEVHILSGGSNFKQFILQTGTALHETSDNFVFQLGDWNRDGKSDLIAIKKNQTGTRSTEIHILLGSTNFSNFILQTGTALHETLNNFEFASDDWTQDGFADLIAIKKSNTGTGTTEVHVVSATTYLQ